MRGFLRRHSAVYQKIVRPFEREAAMWEDYCLALREMHKKTLDRHSKTLGEMGEIYDSSVASINQDHAAEMATARAANHRIRTTNRDLVSKIRELGVPAAEWPASRCPHCLSLASVPEQGVHQIGIVRHNGETKKLFCDGREE